MGRAPRRAARAVAVMAVTVVIVWLLFTVVFPWVNRRISDPVLGAGPGDVAPLVLVVDSRA